jgi:hypothetical protein
MREQAEAVAQELAQGRLRVEPGKASLVNTRNEVRRAWLAVGDILIRERQPELAAHIKRFADQMTSPLTGKEYVAQQLLQLTKNRDQSARVPIR